MTAQPVVICTIFAHNYLAFARVLIQSIKQQHPDILCTALIVDHAEHMEISFEGEAFEVLTPQQINIPHWQHFAMKYDALEVCTNLKPFFMAYLFEHYHAEKVIYFDADIRVYSSLQPLLDLLDTHTALLTPHILAPYHDNANPPERVFLQVGTFNLGFFALARRGDWQHLLMWWQEKLYTQGTRAIEQGLFVDQHWADLFPSLFAGVHILRENGYNTAYWNLGHRALTKQAGQYEIDGKPLVFFHYSGIVLDHLEVVSQHQDRHRLSNLSPSYQQIFHDYAQAVRDQGYDPTNAPVYGYAYFADGVPIPYPLRVCLRQHDPKAEYWSDPFIIQGENTFRQWALTPQKNGLSLYAETLYTEHKAILPPLAPVPYMEWLMTQENQAPIFHSFYLDPLKTVAPEVVREGLLSRTCRYFLDFPTVVAPTLPPESRTSSPAIYTGPNNFYGRIRHLLHRLGIVQGVRRIVGLRLIMTARFFFAARERER